MTVFVEIADEVTDQLVADFERLVPQLSSSSPPPTREQLDEIVASPATFLLLRPRRGRTVLGSLTLVLFRIPTGLRAWIEDVVVDGDARVVASARRSTASPSTSPPSEGPQRRPHQPPPAARPPTASTAASASPSPATNVYRYQGS
ncbi:MAG: hypothetical protein R2711_07115 [Acidimicrobiales bacterium]